MNKQSEKLAKAIAYEAKKKKERDEDKRPAFHVTPTTGWCNDPNGFSRFGEEYHLFYQYYPRKTYSDVYQCSGKRSGGWHTYGTPDTEHCDR